MPDDADRFVLPLDLPKERLGAPTRRGPMSEGASPAAGGRLTSADVSIDEQIKGEDATFRRKLAFRLFLLFVIAVLTGPVLILGSVVAEGLRPETVDFPGLLDKTSLLSTSIIGTVAGVFGTVMGFYYGTEKG